MKKLFKKLFKRYKIPKPTDKARHSLSIDRGTTIIHHYCPHTYNAGDHFVIKSIRKSIFNHIGNALFIPKPCARNRGWGGPFRLTGKNIETSNEFADAVIVGGSDQYKGWSLRIKQQEIKKLLPPLYFIGLGASSADIGSPPLVDQMFYDDIIAAHQATKMASVRDDLTARFLMELGIENIEVTGCPATYLFNEKFDYRESGPILLTFPFPVLKDNSEKLKKILQLQKDLIKYLRSQKKSYIIVCHDDRDVFRAQELFPEERFFFSNYPEDYFDLYRSAKLTVGTRLHASILCAGMGTPFININIDARGKGFEETFKMQDWNIDYNQVHSLEDIVRKIEIIESGDISRFETFYSIKSTYKEVYQNFMKRLSEDILSRL